MAFRFLPQEAEEMERILESKNFNTPKPDEIHEIAARFTAAREKMGGKPVLWKQIWNWFQNKRHTLRKVGMIKKPGTEGVSLPDRIVTPQHGRGEETAPKKYVPTPISPAPHLPPPKNAVLEFEARSARDGAWYDVDRFIGTQRQTGEGETEVQVCFAGFPEDESEWVNARNSVRQRSLPCESSECILVLPNDIVLTFQEANEQALYFDADVLDVQRRRHDVRGCRCRFWVRYRHDGNEEVVPLRKLCRRPETEFRMHATLQASASWESINGGGTKPGGPIAKGPSVGSGGGAPLVGGTPKRGLTPQLGTVMRT